MKVKLFINIIVALMCSMLTACASINSKPTAAKLAITYATLSVIDAKQNKEERAHRIIDIATEAKLWIDNNDVMLADLEKAINKRISDINLSPSDSLLAQALVIAIGDELKKRIPSGVIRDKDKVTVTTVLQWVIDSATLATEN